MGPSITVTLELSDFGVDEEVDVPAAREATDVTDTVVRQVEQGTA